MATINGNANNNTLQGDINGVPENDSLFGFGGNDSLFGFGGNDVLDGGTGADVINGGNGFDSVSYTSSTSAVTVNLGLNSGGGDTLFSIENVDGSNFDDTLIGDNNGTIGNRLRGFGGGDLLDGFSGQDRLDGGNGSDQIYGGAGDDTLYGGSGGDVLRGEFGTDTFLFRNVSDSRGSASDSITDFESLDNDVIDLQEIDANTGSGGNQAFSFIGANGFSGHAGELRFQVDGVLTEVQADVNGDRTADLRIVLADPIQLSADDFLL